MEKPDSNGFVNITWPSKNIPHGGIFHTRVAETSNSDKQFLKTLLEESKLSIALRSKDVLGLRKNEPVKAPVEHRAETRVVRPRTSRRRSLSEIRNSGIFDVDQYRPFKRGEDREKMKEQLANTMAFGDTPQRMPQPPRATKPKPKLPKAKQTWNDIVTQIRERTEWLAEMEYLGQADAHRDIINDQIAERMRALDALGIDSVCSSARSTATGFSTTRSREVVGKAPTPVVQSQRSVSSKSTGRSGAGRKLRSRPKAMEENVASYGQLTPLQYSPRRRV